MRSLKIIFLLFTISVLISQSLMDLFSTLLCLYWVYLWWTTRQSAEPIKLLRPMGLEKWWLAWVTVVIVGFILNWKDAGYAFERIIEFKWILIFYILFQALLQMKPEKEILKFLIPFAGLVSTVTLFLYFADFEILNPWRYGAGEFLRAGGFFANPMTFAHSFVFLLSLLVGITLLNWKKWDTKTLFWMGLVLLMSLFSLYLTFTRGIWIGFGTGLACGVFLWRPKYLIGLAFAAVLTFWISYSVSQPFRSRIDGTTAEMQGFSERKLIWSAHFKIFKQNPIWGAGYGQNTKQLPQVYAEMGADPRTLVSHAHNQYLHLAAGTGILGLICYLAVWIFFLRRTYDLWKNLARDSWDRGICLGLLIGQIAFLVGGFTESNFEHSKVRFMVMLVWAYVIYLTEKYNKNSDRELRL